MEPPLLAEPEPIERQAYRDLFAGAGAPDLRRRLGLSAETCGSALVLRSPALDHVLFNRAMGLRCADPEASELAESVVARYRAQRIARYVVQVQTGAPCPTSDRLQALGLRRQTRGWHKLVRGRAALPAARSALRVERARETDARALAALLADGFELPDLAVDLLAGAARSPRWHAYVVRDVENAPYAGVLMYANAERAYVAMAATDRRHRRRGAERALIAHAVQDALDLGCRELAAESAEPRDAHPNSSHHNLTYNGFELAEVHDNWAPADAMAVRFA